jgi:uncharacterized repeat protein (TIGR01451 family)
MLFDTDGVLNTYEYLIMVDGISQVENVSIRRNTSQKTIDSPSDASEMELYNVPLVTGVNYRILPANTSINGTQDYFLDWSLNFQDYLAATGLSPDQPIRTYWGSSNSTQSLAADVCDVGGSDTLSAGFSDVVTFWGTTTTNGTVSFAGDLLGNGNPSTADIAANLYIKVIDGDRNFTPDVAQTLTATIAGNGDSANVTLAETAPDSGVFTGQIPTEYASVPNPADLILQALGGTVFTVTYFDAVDASIPVRTNLPRTAPITMRASAVTVTKTVSPSAAAGRAPLTYTITITNAGPGNARVSDIIDTLPASFTYTSATTSGLTASDPSIAGQALTWTGPWTLNPGSSATLSFSAKAGGPRGTVYNNVTVTGKSFAPVSTGDTAPVQVIAPLVSLTKSVDPAAALPGQEITYTVHYKNAGDASAHTLLVLDSIPPNTVYIAGSLRAGDGSSTYATATPRTDAPGEAGWPEVQGEVSGSNITFNITSLAADDGIPDSGPDEGKAYFKVQVQ